MSVFVTDLDDFILPSQACVVTTSAPAAGKTSGRAVAIAIDHSSSEFDLAPKNTRPSIIRSKARYCIGLP